MIELVGKISGEIVRGFVRNFTGNLFTDEQIITITKGAIGKYFAEFFPIPKDELAAQERVEKAQEHIKAAGVIIRDMQDELEDQNQKLGELLEEVEQKKKLADRYQTLAQTNEESFQAFREEMQEALKKELQEQTEKGRRIRQVVSIFFWAVTLLIGAALGSYFKNIVELVQSVIKGNI